MSFALTYSLYRFLYRIGQFFKHWYAGGFLTTLHTTRYLIYIIDGWLALGITVRNIFKPLYRERGIIGYVLGFVFRSFRILTAVAVYIVVSLGALAFYAAWAALPMYILYRFIFYYGFFA